MKKLVIFLFIVLAGKLCLAQNVYYDASKLRRFLKSNVFTHLAYSTPTEDSLTKANEDATIAAATAEKNALRIDSIRAIRDDSLFSLLKKYFPEITDSMSSAQVTAIINQNPFLRDINFAGKVRAAQKPSFLNLKSGGLGGLAGVNVTKYANAIADIMIERAKQELTIAFFNRFRDFAEKNPEFEILFPKTTSNLKNLLTYTYPQMLPALRNGFFEDLKGITYRLDDVLELPRYRVLLNELPEVRVAIRSIRLIHDLEMGVSTIADVIKEFAEFEEWKQRKKPAFNNMANTIQLAALFSEALRSVDTTRIWVSGKEIKGFIKDSLNIKLFMALLYQEIKNKDLKFDLNVSANNFVTIKLDSLIRKTRSKLILYETKISEFVNLADKLTASYKEVKNKIDSGIRIATGEIYNYINLSIDVADYTFSVVKIFEEKLVPDEYLSIARKSNALFKDIYSEEYTQAINDAIDILSSVYELAKKDKPDLSNPLEKLLEQLNEFIQDVKPYALFMANVIEAEDEADVKAALENVILPVGSSSIKKNTDGWGNVSVQTYLGAYASLTDNNSVNQGAWSDKFGVIAPIGISWTPGFLSWKTAGSLSIFGSLFDLGAIVDYKLKKDSIPNSSGTGTEVVVDKDYEVKFGQIFSPGGYLVYGFPWNLPLSLGVGAQYGPGLSKIEAGDNAVLTNPSWRWNVFLAVDMPFFTLKNKVKSKK